MEFFQLKESNYKYDSLLMYFFMGKKAPSHNLS